MNCSVNSIEISDEKESSTNEIEFFSISLWRFAILTFLTAGLYETFWSYKNWKAVKIAEGRKISPLFRAIFSVFYSYSFFKKVILSANKQNFSHYNLSGLLAIIYIILVFTGLLLNFQDNTTLKFNILFFLFGYTPYILLLYIQKAINFNNSKINKYFTEKRRFSKGEIIIIIMGFALFVFGFTDY